jgi:hypothetical protein
MKILKKSSLIFLFSFYTIFFAVGIASAQTWTAMNSSAPNPCRVNGSAASSTNTTPGQCVCNQGYSYAKANNANCTMSGFIPGCWNPTSGTCNTCGAGGTVALGSVSCFNNGQSNQGGTDPNIPMGISCTQTSQCANGGSSGGFSTN